MATHTMPGFFQAAGEQTTFMIVAKDANGVQKSLGGDRFAVTWCHNGNKACTTGKLLVSTVYILCLHVLNTFPVSIPMSTQGMLVTGTDIRNRQLTVAVSLICTSIAPAASPAGTSCLYVLYPRNNSAVLLAELPYIWCWVFILPCACRQS